MEKSTNPCELICDLIVTTGKIDTMIRFADDAATKSGSASEDVMNAILILGNLAEELKRKMN